MKKIIYRSLDFIPTFIFHIINFFRYTLIYHGSIVSPKAILYKTKLGYKTTIGGEVGCFNCTIGDFTYLNSGLGGSFGNQITSNLTNVEIGKFCSIGPNLQIPGGNHKTNAITTSPINYLVNNKSESEDIIYKKTKIGNDVMIGVNVTIISGVDIGDGSIIGAGAVVTKSVEPYTIVGGVPAKIIKKRYDQETINKLLKIQWRNRPLNIIKENTKIIGSENIKEFLEKFEKK